MKRTPLRFGMSSMFFIICSHITGRPSGGRSVMVWGTRWVIVFPKCVSTPEWWTKQANNMPDRDKWIAEPEYASPCPLCLKATLTSLHHHHLCFVHFFVRDIPLNMRACVWCIGIEDVCMRYPLFAFFVVFDFSFDALTRFFSIDESFYIFSLGLSFGLAGPIHNSIRHFRFFAFSKVKGLLEL